MAKAKNEYFQPEEFYYIGWKYYHTIKKKAMESEFSWSGLGISLSVAFFIVVGAAFLLSFLFNSVFGLNFSTTLPPKYYQPKNFFPETTDNFINPLTAYLAKTKNLLVQPALAAGQQWQAKPQEFTHFLKAQPGQEIKHGVRIKNLGTRTWKKGEVFLETGPFLHSFSRLKHKKWLNYYRLTGLKKDIAPGQTAELSFYLQTPDGLVGTIQENVQLVVNNYPIAGSLVRIFVDIKNNPTAKNSQPAANLNQPNPKNFKSKTKNATFEKNGKNLKNNNLKKTNKQTKNSKPDFCAALSLEEQSMYKECNTSQNEESGQGEVKANLIYKKEPIIRVGLFHTKVAQRVKFNSYYDVYAGQQILFSGLSPQKIVVVSFNFKKRRYAVTVGALTRFTSSPIRLIPRNQQAIATLLDYQHLVKWNKNYNDNQFRQTIEFHYSAITKKLWVINELLMSNYLKGLAETTNYSPLEFQKVLVTAARTYALYHYGRGQIFGIPDGSTKHEVEHFHVDATYDQVYRGYGSEVRMPKLAEAIKATRGMAVTYHNHIVVTPYFSRSDGRTRSWTEVWGGQAKPWLVSVAVPEDQGQILWGHGVGLSARGALLMARNENKTWRQILTYFYQHTKIQKVYP